jgi:hypothetical protein
MHSVRKYPPVEHLPPHAATYPATHRRPDDQPLVVSDTPAPPQQAVDHRRAPETIYRSWCATHRRERNER